MSRTPSAQQSIEAALVTAIFDEDFNGLSIEDSCLRLNSIAAAVSGLASLQTATSNNEMVSVQCLSIVSQEIDRIMDVYERVLEVAVKEIVERYILREYSSTLHDVFFAASGNIIEVVYQSRYTIDGGEMERRVSSNELMQNTSALLDEKSIFHNIIRPHISFSVHHELLRVLAMGIGEIIISLILKTNFTEWGSMLLHQEVIGTVDCVEQEAASVDITVRPWFAKLLWALKILTLDQPADIRRYRLPGPADIDSYLDDDTVRNIMSRRIDLSKDALEKVRIGRAVSTEQTQERLVVAVESTDIPSRQQGL